MATTVKHKDNLKVLKDEASKVMDDLSNLGKVLSEVGEEKTAEVREKADSYLTQEFERLHERINALSEKIAESTKVADKHVRANPYLYILGSLGLGFLLGKVMTPRSRD